MNYSRQYYKIDEEFRPECPICGCIDDWEISNDRTINCPCCGFEFLNVSNLYSK